MSVQKLNWFAACAVTPAYRRRRLPGLPRCRQPIERVWNLVGKLPENIKWERWHGTNKNKGRHISCWCPQVAHLCLMCLISTWLTWQTAPTPQSFYETWSRPSSRTSVPRLALSKLFKIRSPEHRLQFLSRSIKSCPQEKFHLLFDGLQI